VQPKGREYCMGLIPNQFTPPPKERMGILLSRGFKDCEFLPNLRNSSKMVLVVLLKRLPRSRELVRKKKSPIRT